MENETGKPKKEWIDPEVIELGVEETEHFFYGGNDGLGTSTAS